MHHAPRRIGVEWRHQRRSNALSIQFEICSHLCYFLVVLRDASLLSTCHLSWAPPPLLSSAGLGVACPCKVLRCDLSGFLSAILCQSPLGDIELKLGLGRYGEYVGQSSQWTLRCRLHQAAMQQRPCQGSSLTLSQILSVVEVNELAGAHSPVAARKGHALAECRA